MTDEKKVFEIAGGDIEILVCPVCGCIGDGEIFKATHFSYCMYVAYRQTEIREMYNGR